MSSSPLLRRSFRFRNWIYLPEYNITLGMAPKCGSSTIYKALKDSGTTYGRPTEFKGRCVWFAREPLSRFRSLWANKCEAGQKLSDTHKTALLANMSQEELITFIENESVWNHHWARQSELEGGHATQIVPLVYLDEWWKEQDLPPLPARQNTSNSMFALSPSLTARVMRYYRRDLPWYWNSFGSFTRVKKYDTE